jgi:streptomycin 6-kinase
VIDVPDSLAWWRTEPGGKAWLEQLPRLVAECAEKWQLSLGSPLEGGNISLVLRVEVEEGTRAVLKIGFPDDESEAEADALMYWRGDACVRVLACDHERRALLLERCEPGTPLWEIADEDDANRIAASVLRRIWRAPPPAHRFRALATEARRWASELPEHWEALGRPFERALLDEAVAACIELAVPAAEEVVLHQDFHGGNVLRATREPWLVIDPKPLVGEPAFDAASLLRDRRWEVDRPGAARKVRRRLDLLADELGLERERMRRWGIAHALAWGVDATKLEPDMIACARLLREAR